MTKLKLFEKFVSRRKNYDRFERSFSSSLFLALFSASFFFSSR